MPKEGTVSQLGIGVRQTAPAHRSMSSIESVNETVQKSQKSEQREIVCDWSNLGDWSPEKDNYSDGAVGGALIECSPCRIEKCR